MDSDSEFIGQSAHFQDAVDHATRLALLERPVLVVGERGTGKELIAERLHRLSRRWDQPYIIVNCAAIPETLIEAELFGHEAGAFTGAVKNRVGRFEEAHGGTLFLDELATMSMSAQERLLRAVEYGEITRVGASRPLRVDVRIVGATNEDLPALAQAHKFRADLLDRLSFEVITLPPLRVREGDVAVLAHYFGQRMAVELDWEEWPGFATDALAVLEHYDWPGNVRELRNVVERAVARWSDSTTAVEDIIFNVFASPWQPLSDNITGVAHGVTMTEALPSTPPTPAQTLSASAGDSFAVDNVRDLRTAVEAYERAILATAMVRCRYNQKMAAQALGLSYDQIRHALKKHNLN